MKILGKISGVILALVLVLVTAGQAYAMSPTLTASSQNNGNVQITVNADSNATINLYERQTSTLYTVVTNIGQTNYSGYFTQPISVSSDGSNNPIQMYVTVNGQQSNIVQVYNGNNGGCTYNCGTGYNGLTLSQSSINMNVGQTTTVTAVYGTYNYGNNTSIYISSNSNSNVATASSNGNTVSVYGQNYGTTNIVICGSNSQCATLYVTVNGSGTSTGLSLSQSTLAVTAGQTASISVNNSNFSSVYLLSNGNSGVATANVNGNTITIYGQSAGTTTMSFCTSSYQCATLYVTVSGSSSGNSITLSPSNVTVNAGQTAIVTAQTYPYNNAIYISSNSNSSVASAVVSGSTITVYGYSNGSTTLNICSNNAAQCASLYVTVNNNNGGNNGSITFSQNNINLSFGQTGTVSVVSNNSYGYTYAISSNSNASVASAYISGSTVYITPINSGSTTFSICQSNSYVCSNLYVTVNGSNNGGYGSLVFTTTTLPQPVVNQYYNFPIQVTGGSSPYFFTLIGGNLPNGLTLSNSGNIIGTPQASGNSSATIRVTDTYGRSATNTFTLNAVGGSVLGANVYANGTLIAEGQTVYLVYKNIKTAFSSAYVFSGLGYSFNNVIAVGNSGLASSGYIINSLQTSHPWGAWVKSGSTIYFVHELGLIPVPDYDTFLNNNGGSVQVVNANIYDFRLPVLSPMTFNDSRLR